MPEPGPLSLVAICWELRVIEDAMFRKQVSKVETVDVTVDSFDFVLYLVYLYSHGPRHAEFDLS